MFETIKKAAPDPILGLTEAFKADTNPDKINLGVGIYKDAQGRTPVLQAVKRAEGRLLEQQASKAYLPIDGAPEFGRAVQQLMFGPDHAILREKRARTSHTPGGTGALRVIADYLHVHHPQAKVWLSTPTWANHPAIFAAAGVQTASYPYYDSEKNGFDEGALLEALERVPAGDVVLLHGCCHNPTGVDPTPQQWSKIGAILAQQGALPLVDFAYQGFAVGLEQDAAGLLALAETCSELVVCSSFSKNFGLYRERTGALTVVGQDAAAADAVQSNIKVCVRRNYSNPPAHGGEAVLAILTDPELDEQWRGELNQMRERIAQTRRDLKAALDARGVALNPSGNDFIVQQNGMFSFSGLNKQQVGRLREEFSIYIVGSGRINVAGIAPDKMERLCDAIASVAR
jgi:aspartate/tyrosine/aromatic aminotransferase